MTEDPQEMYKIIDEFYRDTAASRGVSMSPLYGQAINWAALNEPLTPPIPG